MLVMRTCLALSVLLLVGMVGRSSAYKVHAISISTPLGDVSTELYNEAGTKTVIAIHGMNSVLTGEWSTVAAHLARDGYRIMLPNLHSNPRTKPGIISPGDFARVMLSLQVSAGAPVIWMGKSWGGANVATFASNHPKSVLRLVLDAPALAYSDIADTCSRLNAAGSPLLLLWAEDDSVIPFANAAAWRSSCTRVLLHSVPTGGHRILPEYAVPISTFLRATV